MTTSLLTPPIKYGSTSPFQIFGGVTPLGGGDPTCVIFLYTNPYMKLYKNISISDSIARAVEFFFDWLGAFAVGFCIVIYLVALIYLSTHVPVH